MRGRLGIHSRRGAYMALGALTLIWGSNWITMKLALQHADPVVLNVQRTWLAALVLFAVLIAQGRPLAPASWLAIVVTGFFQTTINFGSTTMALAGGGAGRTSVLVFTMPFWTLLIAWPVLHERVRGSQWLAVVLAFAGLTLVVAPWDWSGDLTPKLWAVFSGFGWAAGTVATKYFQRGKSFDPLNFMAWQMAIGVLPLTLLPVFADFPATRWSPTYALLLVLVGVVSTGIGFMLWIAILRFLPAGTASLNMFAIPVIALVSSMLVFGERLTENEWIGIALIGAGLAIVSLHAWRASRRGGTAPPAPTPLDGG
ncbi:MAG: DMT family transporter [Betaproteobacteria bacterium]|jgi:drug/metabolite transporter (DMT)-like permease|nr:DMT family transporter [Betaproteobacteria bacterium]